MYATAGGRRRTSSPQNKPSQPRPGEKRGNGGGGNTETTQTEPPPDTDSARQRIAMEMDQPKNQKADVGITVGHEVETKKHRFVFCRAFIYPKHHITYSLRIY